MNELNRVLQKLKNGQSPGEDKMSAEMIKKQDVQLYSFQSS